MSKIQRSASVLIICFLLMIMILYAYGQRPAADGTIWNTLLSDDKDALTDFYGDYRKEGGEIALLTGGGTIQDQGFVEAIWEGVKTYANAAGESYSYYDRKGNSPKACEKSIRYAVKQGARLIVCAGYTYNDAVESLQGDYPDVNFLLIDGPFNRTDGSLGNNVCGISFHEAPAGYLAGYMAVADGYRRLGFMGGEETPSVIAYGYGYLQGINDAAQELGVENEIYVEYIYTGSFLENRETEKTAEAWYESGTEIIFACGGSVVHDVVEAAETKEKMVIGVDKDQRDVSPRIVTSADKGIERAVVIALDNYFAGGEKWPEEMAGRIVDFGLQDWCPSLPIATESWRFQNVTEDQYDELYGQLLSGSRKVSERTDEVPQLAVRVNGIN